MRRIPIVLFYAVLVLLSSMAITNSYVAREVERASTDRIVLREFTDVEKWKLFLYYELLQRGFGYKDYSALNKVFECESNWNQFNSNGTVLISITNDIGIAQINKRVHQTTYTKMGLDVTDPYDNIRFALYLYSKNGIHDWRFSGQCHQK